jgi:hypothetical protein
MNQIDFEAKLVGPRTLPPKIELPPTSAPDALHHARPSLHSGFPAQQKIHHYQENDYNTNLNRKNEETIWAHWIQLMN